MAPIPTLHSFLPSLLAVIATVDSIASADLRLDGGTEYGWDTSAWRSQVDGVMGGKSSGSLSFERNNSILSFSGDVVLDGGGFSSVRKAGFDQSLDLTRFAGIVVTLETTFGHSDNNGGGSIRPPLGLHLQFHDTVSRYSVGYASAFAIPLSATAGEETSVYLPLSSFDRGSRMGFVCTDCAIDWSSVDEMDIYVLFQKGTFDVKVKEIVAVDSPRVFDMPVIDDIGSAEEVRSLIQSTIRSGGGLYDYGYMELCIAIYRSTLNTLLGSVNSDGDDDDGVVSMAIKDMICQGLQRAEIMQNNNGKSSTAWALRNTMDGILEEMGFLDPDQGNGWRPITTMEKEDGETTTTLVCQAVTSGAYISIVTSDPTQRPSTKSPTTLLPTTSMPVVRTIEPTTNKPTLPPTLAPTAIIMKPTNLPSTTMPIQTTTLTMEQTTSPIATSTTTLGPTSLKPFPTPSSTPTETVQSTINPIVRLTTAPSITATLGPTTVETTAIETMIPAGSPSPMLANGDGERTNPASSSYSESEEPFPAKMLDDGSTSSSALLCARRMAAILTSTIVLLHVGL